MMTYDFEYDGKRLSDFGYMICQFGSNGLDTVSGGSQITFNTVGVQYGELKQLVSTEYSDVLSTKFQICRKDCVLHNEMISVSEYRKLMRWLNRKGFYKFKLINDEYSDIYFEASFNINKIKLGDDIFGLELDMQTNRPFALLENKHYLIPFTSEMNSYVIMDESDNEGYIYPKMEIQIEESGDLIIHNSIEDRHMIINNCTSGEVINLDYPIIYSSNESHKIADDFNWEFFRIANSYKNNKNIITTNISCVVKLDYSPICKIGF